MDGSFMGLFSSFFARHKATKSPSPGTSYHGLDGDPVAIKLKEQDIRSAREVIHRAAIFCAKIYGIPPHWVSFEVVSLGDKQGNYFQLQVVLQHWDDYFVTHIHAMELAIMKRISDENKDIGRAVRAVLFRVAPNAGCPYDEMPQPSAWMPDKIRLRLNVRDRVLAELHASQSHATMGAKAQTQTPAGTSAAMLPQAAVLRIPVRDLPEDSTFGETRPSAFDEFVAKKSYPVLDDTLYNQTRSGHHGFAATQPFRLEPRIDADSNDLETPPISTFQGFAATQPYAALTANKPDAPTK
jgi:hypothetical protein